MDREKGPVFVFSDSCPCTSPVSRIPADRVLDRLDRLVAVCDYPGAARHLDFWLAEARAVGDLRGEFTVLNEMMGVYRKMDEGAKALDCAEAALALIPVLDIGDTVGAGTAYVNAGTVNEACGRSEKAIACFEEAMRIYDAGLGETDPRRGGLYNNMALSLTGLGRYEEARRYFLKAVDVMRRAPRGTLEEAITLLNLANTAEAELGFEEAEEEITDLLSRAEGLLTSPFPERDAYYAFVCEKCTPTFRYYGWFRTADELTGEAEKIRAAEKAEMREDTP